MSQRTKLGLIALVCIASSAALFFFGAGDAGVTNWSAGLWRVGIVLAVVWLALPRLHNVSPWMAVVAGSSLLVLARWPKYFLAALVVAAALSFIKPRTTAPKR